MSKKPLPFGLCSLCQKLRELRSSHFIPAGIFRILKSRSKIANALVEVKESPATSVLTSKEPQTYLLCNDCEVLFNNGGENFVIPQCQQSATDFPLRQILQDLPAVSTCPALNVGQWRGDLLPEGVASHYLYFATSIFWRGSVCRWSEPPNQIFSSLPDAESIRKYLKGYLEAPPNTELSVFVNFGTDTLAATIFSGLVTEPHVRVEADSKGLHSAFRWFAPGLRFEQKTYHQSTPIAASPDELVNFFEWHTIQHDADKVAQGILRTTPKGKLAGKWRASPGTLRE